MQQNYWTCEWKSSISSRSIQVAYRSGKACVGRHLSIGGLAGLLAATIVHYKLRWNSLFVSRYISHRDGLSGSWTSDHDTLHQQRWFDQVMSWRCWPVFAWALICRQSVQQVLLYSNQKTEKTHTFAILVPSLCFSGNAVSRNEEFLSKWIISTFA